MTAVAPSQASQPWRENLSHHLICPDCKESPPDLIEEDASTICASCGMVLADRVISLESEWRTFANDDGKNNDDPSRVGEATNALLNSSQLETTISFAPGGSKYSRDMRRAHDTISDVKKDKALTAAYRLIDQDCEEAGIQRNVRETAKSYYKQIEDQKLFKSKPQEVVRAGVIFIACRQCKVARSFQEMFQMTNVPKKEIGKIYKQLEKFLLNNSQAKIAAIEAEGGVVNLAAESYNTTTSTKPNELCARFCNMLGLPYAITNIAEQLANKISTVETLAGRSPLSTAAACIYMASFLMGEGKSAKQISQVAKVSDGTIRTAYKFLYAEREKLIQPEWLGPGKGDKARLPVA